MKTNYWLIIILALLSPSQLGVHFWPEWSLVSGIRVDYLSPTIYLSDLFFSGLFIITAVKFRHSKFLKILFSVFFILLLFSGRGNISSVYWTLRYLQIPTLAWLIFVNGNSFSFTKDIKKYLSFSLIFVLFLEVWQFIIKKSTGWWWIFGERSFSLSTPNIATVDLFGQEFLRPYATFSHPNALAGWLLLVMFILWNSKPKRLLALAGILLTFSRNALLAVIAGTIFYSALTGRNALFSIVSFSQNSIGERLILNQSALKVFFDHPISGVGPGKLLSVLPEYFPPGFWSLQPPHNIYFLILAETGIIGLTILIVGILYLYLLLRRNPAVFPGLAAVISTSLLDHYWLTSQQNRILLGIFLGLGLVRSFRGNYQTPVTTVSFGKRRNVRSGRKLHVNNSSFSRS